MTIEELFLLHTKLEQAGHCYGAVRQNITWHTFGCSGGEKLLEFRTKIAAQDMPPDHEKYQSFMQGFYCLDIHLTATVAECKQTKIKFQILDRLESVGMAKQSWTESGALLSKKIEASEILPLVETFFPKPKKEEPVIQE